MKNYGLTSVSEFLGDFIIYRNLNPADPRLPALETLRAQEGMSAGSIPRKSEPAYAEVVARLLKRARAIEAPDAPLQQVIYIGDTRLNDGQAFLNICKAGGWQGIAFIGSERSSDPPQVDVVEQEQQTVYLANRWTAIEAFDSCCRERGFIVGPHTAVVLDLDKTTLGARGRNDHMIDRTRVAAVHQTVATLLGESFNSGHFQTAYTLLNQPEFHPFTADNQDYLAYICLIIGSGLYALEPLVAEVRGHRIESFSQFITQVEARADALPDDLCQIHQEIYALVQAGDPTPFKAFRYNEYQMTVSQMGVLPKNAPAEACLEQEITLTQEVRECALTWKSQGALLFGLSDKPDEASIPSQALADQGYLPIHRAITHAVGE
ncbi:MAG: hypothetical protein RBT47_10510 [Anaerolineae bacterium]|jgi:hypothetical protein|nr:hypothetical protein [Anaerolineae bacterium]